MKWKKKPEKLGNGKKNIYIYIQDTGKKKVGKG